MKQENTKLVQVRFDFWGSVEVPANLTPEQETDFLFQSLREGRIRILHSTLKEKREQGVDK